MDHSRTWASRSSITSCVIEQVLMLIKNRSVDGMGGSEAGSRMQSRVQALVAGSRLVPHAPNCSAPPTSHLHLIYQPRAHRCCSTCGVKDSDLPEEEKEEKEGACRVGHGASCSNGGAQWEDDDGLMPRGKDRQQMKMMKLARLKPRFLIAAIVRKARACQTDAGDGA